MKMKMNLCCAVALLFSCLSSLADAQDVAVVEKTLTGEHDKTGVRVVKGTVSLPASPIWAVEHAFDDTAGLTEIFAVGDEAELADPAGGERMAVLKDRKEISARGHAIHYAYYACRNFAERNEGRSPNSLAELTQDDWSSNRSATGIHLIPAEILMEKKERPNGGTPYWRPVESEELLLIDITPAIDDGKHWVITLRGQSKRVQIDRDLLTTLGVEVKPVALPNARRNDAKQQLQMVTLYARVSGKLPTQPVQLTLKSGAGDEGHLIRWDLKDAEKADADAGNELVAEWAEQRAWALDAALRSGVPIGGHWLRTLARQYDLHDEFRDYFSSLFPRQQNGNRNRRNARTATAMGVLGGRAAIDETLQLQGLAVGDGEAAQKPEHSLAEMEGVKVEAHPFEEMLDGADGGRITLADWVPEDRLMVYLPKPKKIFSLLNGGTDFVFQAGAGVTGRSFSYGLKQRYLEKFGFSEALLQRFLNSGAVEEMAVTLPDLFLIDGTDMSVVMRTGKPLLTNTALALIGVKSGDGASVTKTATGGELHWFRRGEILLVSSSKAEVTAMVEAAADDGKNSLGRSAELRYMLTQVPVTAETAAYGYLSDPFIRQLVGPEVKIGQRRRMLARAELEGASAAALLARRDGHGDKAYDREFLQNAGYLIEPRYATDLRIDSEGVSHSPKYGRAASMRSLDELSIDLVTTDEKTAYELYLAGYERYWRRFFDPIALRYEQRENGEQELETFILPLIDNTLYSWLRDFLPEADAPQSLQVPVLDPPPIATLSVNLNEKTWLDILEDFYDTFEGVLGLDPVLLDLLGPDVHLSVQDADPIVTIGNGELAGMLGQVSGRNSDFFWIQAMVSIFTRPTTVHIGLTDPAAAAKLLTDMAWAPGENDDFSGGFGSGSLYKVGGEERWIYRYSIEGLVTLRFSLEVQDRYLVINNQPFSNPVQVTGNVAATESSARLMLDPRSCELQLPALFASAAESLRSNAVIGAACLTPMFQSAASQDGEGGEISASKMAGMHHHLFGFSPQHPAGGEWNWDSKEGELVSDLYGPYWQNIQPSYDPENDKVGLLRQIPEAKVQMRFEQDGLRSTIVWKLSPK